MSLPTRCTCWALTTCSPKSSPRKPQLAYIYSFFILSFLLLYLYLGLTHRERIINHAAIATILLYIGVWQVTKKFCVFLCPSWGFKNIFFKALLALLPTWKLQIYLKNENCLYKCNLDLKLAAITGSALTIFSQKLRKQSTTKSNDHFYDIHCVNTFQIGLPYISIVLMALLQKP